MLPGAASATDDSAALCAAQKGALPALIARIPATLHASLARGGCCAGAMPASSGWLNRLESLAPTAFLVKDERRPALPP